ncbi:DUF1566 domain-containing protein [Terasakiella sp. A23]|uniref:Lcl C-terminal domain-containing protein n=1 Tax=Terasakiella sp. FCG-A23 TaxID=3080561 RepID=UPI002952EEE9|nr:DUF1566 domain-containing protein [Terasakiella sp. A23]MDV7339956.1 DUF1566 domain-containing protein [Terasakiella sp. A23]
MKLTWFLTAGTIFTIGWAALNVAEASEAGRKIGTTYRVVDTGQTKCYDAGDGWGTPNMDCPASGDFFGQDAQYTINAPHYKDNGDGTVSDLVSGLMWQKRFYRNTHWNTAEDIARNATEGGHKDWRVPTIKELYSLINHGGATGRMDPNSREKPSDAVPYLNTEYFDFEYPPEAPSGTYSSHIRYIDSQYITSTIYEGFTMGRNKTFFGVNFADGRIKGYPVFGQKGGDGFYLRLVRGNPEYGKNKFATTSENAVMDAATGLTWMKADTGHFVDKLQQTKSKDGRVDWGEALSFCEGLELDGFSDWRLPSSKELQSLVDYTRSPQRTSSAALDPIFAVTEFKDVRGKTNFPAYWSSTSLLDGKNPGDEGIIVFFGEALGAFSLPSGPGGGDMMKRRPPPPPGGHMRGPGSHPHERPQGGSERGSKASIIDVHGAGAQRSDPKSGDIGDYPVWGHGPQGDVRRVYNYARCVRG